MTRILSSDLTLEIESLAQKFNYSITPLRIRNWLENFEFEDWDKAITLLNYLEYIGEEEIVRRFEQSLNKIVRKVRGQSNIGILPIGEIGKSGTMMTYYLRKCKNFSSIKNRLIFLSSHDQINSVNDLGGLILLDDFIGSGRQASDFFTNVRGAEPSLADSLTHMSQTGKSIKVFLLAAIILESGKKLLEQDIPGIKIYGELRDKLFNPHSSILGSYSKMKLIREFCFQYGRDLFYTKNDDGSNLAHPLGFDNSQGLVAFAHSTPNNTLPIIWSSRFSRSRNHTWYPLFPRSYSYKLSELRGLKEEASFFIAIAKRLNMDILFQKTIDPSRPNSFVGTYDFQFLIFFALRVKGYSIPKICQTIGISGSDSDSLIRQGRNRGVLGEHGEVKEYGKKIFNLLLTRKKLIQRGRQRIEEFSKEADQNILYIPTQFKGKV